MIMDIASKSQRTVTVYSAPTRVLAAVAWAFCAFFAVNLLFTGSPLSIWHFMPWLFFVAWGIFILLWRPQLLIHPEGLSIRNLLRDHEVPFSELTALRVMQTVSFDTSAGRISSWGAPGAGKLGPKMLTGTGGVRTMASLPHTQAMVQAAWDSWEQSHTSLQQYDAGTSVPDHSGYQPGAQPKVTSKWNVPAAVAGVIVLILAILSTLI